MPKVFMFSKATSTTDISMPPPDYTPDFTRKSHICFIAKIYLISTILLACAVLQWYLSVQLKSVALAIVKFNYLILFIILAAFLILLCYKFFFKGLIKKSLVLVIFCTLCTFEFGTVVLLRPIAESVGLDLVYSAALTGVIMLLSVMFSFIKISAADVDDTNFIAAWTIRLFLVSSIGIVVVMALRTPYFEMFFAVFILVVHLFFLLKFGNILGDFDFYQAEAVYTLLFVILVYYNFITLYTTALLFFLKCRLLL